MPRFHVLPALLLLALCPAFWLAASALAEDVPPESEQLKDTRIEVDEQAHVIRFFIDGKEMAVLDALGLHVIGDIDYTGAMNDKGKPGDAP